MERSSRTGIGYQGRTGLMWGGVLSLESLGSPVVS